MKRCMSTLDKNLIAPVPADASRMPCLDALKAIACLAIVMHHLSVYGPMSEIAYPLISGLVDGLYQYGRMAVQAFLVIAGFLSAKNLAPFGVPAVTNPFTLIKRRYDRLIMPYLAALTAAVVCAALARNWMEADYIPGLPDVTQLLAHALLLHDLLDQEALSAGVWYVAIDFQLFAFTALLLWLAGRSTCRETALMKLVAPVLVACLTVASLFVFNRNAYWDETALYFFGSYGLGALSYWASLHRRGAWLLLLLGAMVAATLAVEFRPRIAVAGAVTLLLGFSHYYAVFENRREPRSLMTIGRISYSVFLIHFPLIMLVNAAFFHFLPHSPLVGLVGLILALGLSVWGGALFYRWIENRRHTHRTRLPIVAGFMASSLFSTM